MHFPVFAEKRSVRVDDCGCVVADSRGAVFKQGENQDNAVLLCQSGKPFRHRSRNGLRKVEFCRVLIVAEIRGEAEFLCADDVCAVLRGFGDELFVLRHGFRL